MPAATSRTRPPPRGASLSVPTWRARGRFSTWERGPAASRCCSRVTCVLRERVAFAPGEVIQVGFVGARAHLFDAQSGLALAHGLAAR